MNLYINIYVIQIIQCLFNNCLIKLFAYTPIYFDSLYLTFVSETTIWEWLLFKDC